VDDFNLKSRKIQFLFKIHFANWILFFVITIRVWQFFRSEMDKKRWKTANFLYLAWKSFWNLRAARLRRKPQFRFFSQKKNFSTFRSGFAISKDLCPSWCIIVSNKLFFWISSYTYFHKSYSGDCNNKIIFCKKADIENKNYFYPL